MVLGGSGFLGGSFRGPFLVRVFFGLPPCAGYFF